MPATTELTTKLARLRALLDESEAGAWQLTRAENMAWLSGGGDFLINREGSPIAEMVVTRQGVWLLTNQIEAERLRQEELPEGIPVVVFDWFNPAGKAERLRALTEGLSVLSDRELDLTLVRSPLLEVELERFRELGRLASAALTDAVMGISPELSEQQVAAQLHFTLRDRGMNLPVVLIAGEERFGKHRHPLPQGVPFGRAGLLVICAQQRGLIVSLSRMVAFGAVPQINRERLEQVWQVEAAILDATRPGVPIGEVFAAAQSAYAAVGFPNAWQEHHQGGPTGYLTRDFLATPNERRPLPANVAFAWNPSLPHAKAEDTFLCRDEGLENLTLDPRWPTVTVAGRARADILVL